MTRLLLAAWAASMLLCSPACNPDEGGGADGGTITPVGQPCVRDVDCPTYARCCGDRCCILADGSVDGEGGEADGGPGPGPGDGEGGGTGDGGGSGDGEGPGDPGQRADRDSDGVPDLPDN